MKRYYLILTVLLISFSHMSGEIINGYEKEIASTRRSLRGLTHLLRDHRSLSLQQRKKMKEKIESLVEFIAYFEITEKLLSEFKILAPQLYNEIASVKDRKGRTTDIYVRFIPRSQARVQAAGTTCLAQVADDEHAYCSEYGDGTVSVKIWVISKALWVLAHEFGHVQYQVPNLDNYVEFYMDNYLARTCDPNYIGHNPNDPSGQNAVAFEKRFRERYVYHRKSGYRPQAPMHLTIQIQKKVRAETRDTVVLTSS